MSGGLPALALLRALALLPTLALLAALALHTALALLPALAPAANGRGCIDRGRSTRVDWPSLPAALPFRGRGTLPLLARPLPSHSD